MILHKETETEKLGFDDKAIWSASIRMNDTP